MSNTAEEEQATPDPVSVAMAQAKEAATREEAESLITEAVMLRLHRALTESGESDPDGQIALLQDTGLDRLLLDIWFEKRLTPAAADHFLARAKAALRSGELESDKLKMGIVAFDVMAQRLALVSDPSVFDYAAQANPARDLLIRFAHSLHQ